MREVKERLGTGRPGKIIGGRSLWNIRYADDTTMVAKSREECRRMGEELGAASEEVGLKINKSKTAALSVHGDGELELGGEKIKMVEKCKFLGSYITTKGDSQTDIRSRIGMAKSIANRMTAVWRSSDITIEMKVRLAKSLIWSVALYACESWTLTKGEEKMIDAMELWLWRKVLRVKWTDRRTNEWVRQKVGVSEKNGMLRAVKKRKIRKYGHWKRRGDSMVLATIEGETEGKGRHGRRRMEWMDNIITWEGGVEQAHWNARERRSTVH